MELGLSIVFCNFRPPNHCKFFFVLDIFSGMCPDESYEEAVADMISDGVTDLFKVGVKIFLEKDENKKVHLTALFDEGVEPMFLCILKLTMFTLWV